MFIIAFLMVIWNLAIIINPLFDGYIVLDFIGLILESELAVYFLNFQNRKIKKPTNAGFSVNKRFSFKIYLNS